MPDNTKQQKYCRYEYTFSKKLTPFNVQPVGNNCYLTTEIMSFFIAFILFLFKMNLSNVCRKIVRLLFNTCHSFDSSENRRQELVSLIFPVYEDSHMKFLMWHERLFCINKSFYELINSQVTCANKCVRLENEHVLFELIT